MSEQRSFRSNTPEGCFPANADSITENALKDLYVKLLSSYKSSNQEKLILMENAKKDKMLIQELKNENELLRQTIETEKIKCEFLDKKAKESNSLLNKTLENAHQNSKAEAVNDVIKNLKTETEKYKRDLVLAQAIANNFKTELENLKILNENFKSENDLLNENLKDAKSHLDRSLLKRKELENEIQKLNFDLEKIKKENLQLIEGNKIKSASFFEKFKELSLKYESNNEATLTRHADITKLNEKLACDIEKLKKQLEINEGEKKEILSELTFERENVSHMQKDIDEKEDLIVKLQKDCKELIGEIRLLQEEAESFRNNCSCAELLRIKEEKEESLELLKNQIQNQKNEAFVEKSNFEDNLNSQKKAIEELNKEIKAGLLERNKLEKEIEMLKSKLDIAECSTKNFSEYKSIFETEMLVLKESIEKLQHEKEMLVSSRNSTQNDFNQLSNQYNFLKERLEKEIKLKNEEITEHEKNVESLKKEIAKLKENKKNLHFKSLNDEDIVTNLQSKITELEVREKEYKAKLNDIEGINFEKSNLQKSIDESRKIIAYLENQIKEHKGKTENLMRENSDLKSELTRLNTNQSTLQKEQNGKLEELNKKIIDDLNKEIKKINDLNMNLSKEKETLMSNSFNYKMEINSKQEMLEKIFKENKNLNEFVLELQSGSLSFFSELKIILNKLFSVVKRDNKSIFTQEAFERLNDLITQMNQLNKDNIETESLFDLALNALNSLYEEVDHVYHKFLEAENILCQTNSINQVDKMTIERGEIENEKLINYNKELLNEISFYKLEIEKYKEQQKAMNSQLNNIRKTELIESNTAKSKLEEKVKSLTKDLSESKVDYSKVKNEYEIIMNEKKKLEDFLSL